MKHVGIYFKEKYEYFIHIQMQSEWFFSPSFFFFQFFWVFKKVHNAAKLLERLL